MKTIKKNKKGAISSILLDFWAYVAFVLIVLIFYGFFSFQANGIKENKITGFAYDTQAETVLLNYLRTPAVIPAGNQQSDLILGDLIVNYYLIQNTMTGTNLQNVLIAKTREIFDKQYQNQPGNNLWILAIEEPNNHVILSLDSDSSETGILVSTNTYTTVAYKVATVYLPLNPSTGKTYLEVNLYLRRPKSESIR